MLGFFVVKLTCKLVSNSCQACYLSILCNAAVLIAGKAFIPIEVVVGATNEFLYLDELVRAFQWEATFS